MLRRAADIVLVRYFIASLLALGVDMATFLTLLQLGTAPTLAASAGYSLGIVAHWLLSSRAVFADGLAAPGPERTRQKVLFLLSALFGVGVTTGIVGAADYLGADPRLGKLVAVAVSFTVNWLLRRGLVFRAGARA
ncbi:MAG: GtrA family protein [Novosphingobium sp.]